MRFSKYQNTKEIKVKDLCSQLSKKFACQASFIKASGEIDLQGDVGVDLVYFLIDNYDIPKDSCKLIDKTVKKKPKEEPNQVPPQKNKK